MSTVESVMHFFAEGWWVFAIMAVFSVLCRMVKDRIVIMLVEFMRVRDDSKVLATFLHFATQWPMYVMALALSVSMGIWLDNISTG